MFTIFICSIFVIIGLLLLMALDGPQRLAGFIPIVLAALFFFLSIITIVPDGHVAVTKEFGKFGEETLQPGINLIAPWKSTVDIDTRVQSFTFANDSEGETRVVSSAINAQAAGGGNLTIEHTLQMAPTKEKADDLLREVGQDWFKIIGLPAARSCTRDATVELSVEVAYTTGRQTIRDNIFDCVASKVEPRGIVMMDVLIRDVDPGAAVKAAIDSKQEAEQDLQRAGITLQEEEVKAAQEAVKAYGISQAEQIIACGGTETRDDDGSVIIVPNEDCGDQFSNEYLQWLYINMLAETDNLVVVPSEFDGSLFVNAPNSTTPGQ